MQSLQQGLDFAEHMCTQVQCLPSTEHFAQGGCQCSISQQILTAANKCVVLGMQQSLLQQHSD